MEIAIMGEKSRVRRAQSGLNNIPWKVIIESGLFVAIVSMLLVIGSLTNQITTNKNNIERLLALPERLAVIETRINTYGERITRLESLVESLIERIIVITKDIEFIKSSLTEIKSDIKNLKKTQSHSLLVPVFIDQAYKADYVEQRSSVWRLTEKGEKTLPEKIRLFTENKVSRNRKLNDIDLLSSLYLEFDNQILFQMAHKSGMSIGEMLGTALIYGQEQRR